MPLVAESSYNMLARSHFEPALKAFHRKRNFYHGILIALHREPDIARRAFTLSHGSCFDSCSSTAVELPVGSGCHEGTQDQADQIPNVTSQDRTSRIRKASAVIRHHHGAYHARIVSNKDIFLSLYRLGSDSVQKFEESPGLRSHVVPLQAIYLRCRLVAIIDEPFRTRAISQLRLVLEFRKGHYPTNIALRLPPLAHDLPREVQQILRFLVQRERINFPPLHLPSVKMVEIKARAWSQTVFNFRPFLRSWVPGNPQACASRTWCSSETGHLFAHVRQILPASPLADLNLNDTTFLSDKQDCRKGVTYVAQQAETT